LPLIGTGQGVFRGTALKLSGWLPVSIAAAGAMRINLTGSS
jgi:hypothetical protein